MRATLLQQAAAEHLADRPGWSVVAGVGGLQPSLEGVCGDRTSRRETPLSSRRGSTRWARSASGTTSARTA